MFFGHIGRKEKYEILLTIGKTRGKIGRGKPKEIILDGLRRRHRGTSSIELIHNTREQDLWSNMDA